MPSKTFAGISQAPRSIEPEPQVIVPVEALVPEGDGGDGDDSGDGDSKPPEGEQGGQEPAGDGEEGPQGDQPPAAAPIVPPASTTAPKAAGKRQQARTPAGTFQADDPATPGKNEAFVEG
jgi:hypothetical protein